MKQIVIYVPGLNDTHFINKTLTKFLPSLWKMYGIETYIFRPHWSKGNYQDKIGKLLHVIDTLAKKHSDVYLIGQSAGGSFVLNAFAMRKDSVQKVVNIAGRLTKGNYGFPLSLAAKNSAAFKESVLTFENTNSKKLTTKDRKKILIIRPVFDEIVPKNTAVLKGARVQTIPMIEHTLSGIAACTIFSPIIFRFLTSKK